MDQVFCIGMTMPGMGWNDIMALTDMDRIALVERCTDYNARQQDAVDRMR